MAASGMELYVDQESGDVIREAQEGVPGEATFPLSRPHETLPTSEGLTPGVTGVQCQPPHAAPAYLNASRWEMAGGQLS